MIIHLLKENCIKKVSKYRSRYGPIIVNKLFTFFLAYHFPSNQNKLGMTLMLE